MSSDINNIPDICIEGYDPFPVVFRDMSDVRSFKTKFWKYDFGDSFIFGCSTSASGSPNRNFELPGDSVIMSMASSRPHGSSDPWFKNVKYFHDTEKKCLMCLDSSGYESYHATAGADKHYTGIYFKSSDNSTSGSTVEIDPVKIDPSGNEYRFRRLPNTNTATYIEVTGISDSIIEDQCARNNCEFEYDFGNSVMHVYKGPGLYYATMTCSSETELQGMEVADGIFDPGDKAGKEKIVGCWVNVLPECPCVSGFKVYGPLDQPTEFRTITSSGFSCDDKNFDSCTGTTNFNCFVKFDDFDGSTRTTCAVSGYAPFMHVAASGIMIPRSLPVTGAWIDWGDWATDYMAKDEKKFGEVISGWPVWETRLGGRTPVVSGDHVYTLPGLYSIGIAPEFDVQRITTYMPTVTNYEDCVESTLRRSASGCCVLVVELPPKPINITYSKESETSGASSHPSVLTDIIASFKAGSYPISRVDWDFGDGSDIMTISTEGYKVLSGDVIGNRGSGSEFVDYTTDTTTAVPFGEDNVSDGYLVGNPNTAVHDAGYLRHDCRNYKLSHIYTRTSVDDHPNGYVITCSAYAENTNTCAVVSASVFPNGAGLPHFDEVEEYVEMSDVRSDDTGETNIVLQSAKEDRLYVNRASDTNEDLGSNKDETPAFPRKPKDDGDEPVPGDVIYWFFGSSNVIPGINRVNMSFKDKIKPLMRSPLFAGVASDVDQYGKTWYVRLTITKDLYEGSRNTEDGKKVFEFGVNLDWVFVDDQGVEIDPDVSYFYDPMTKWGKYPQKIKIIVNESEEDGDVVTGTAVVKLLVGEDYDEETKTIRYVSLLSETFDYQRTIIADPNIDPDPDTDPDTDLDLAPAPNPEPLGNTAWDDFYEMPREGDFTAYRHGRGGEPNTWCDGTKDNWTANPENSGILDRQQLYTTSEVKNPGTVNGGFFSRKIGDLLRCQSVGRTDFQTDGYTKPALIISPHWAICADHYSPSKATFCFDRDRGTFKTLNLSNKWDSNKSYVKGDLRLLRITTDAEIPDDIYPYFVKESLLREYYPEMLDGTKGFYQSQHGTVHPCDVVPMTSTRGWRATRPYNGVANMNEIGHTVHSGDSGHAVCMILGGHLVPVGLYKYATSSNESLLREDILNEINDILVAHGESLHFITKEDLLMC